LLLAERFFSKDLLAPHFQIMNKGMKPYGHFAMVLLEKSNVNLNSNKKGVFFRVLVINKCTIFKLKLAKNYRFLILI
jgi:hypothetical protein